MLHVSIQRNHFKKIKYSMLVEQGDWQSELKEDNSSKNDWAAATIINIIL